MNLAVEPTNEQREDPRFEPVVEDRELTEIVTLLRNLARRYKSLVDRISKAELNASLIEFELFQLLNKLEKHVDQSGNKRLPPARGFSTRTRDAVGDAVRAAISQAPLRYLAAAGASSLEIKSRPDGGVELRIDGGKEFTLPPALADLMSVLSREAGPTEDGLVGWKSLKEVADFMSKQSGKPLTRRAVTQSVYRLRKELFNRGGVNPFLIQTNRRRGVRFALRRKEHLVIGGDPG